MKEETVKKANELIEEIEKLRHDIHKMEVFLAMPEHTNFMFKPIDSIPFCELTNNEAVKFLTERKQKAEFDLATAKVKLEAL